MAAFTALGTALGATGSAATWLGLGTVAGAGAVGYSVFSMMNQKKPEQPTMQMPSTPSAPKMEDATAKAKAEADRRRLAASRTKSVRTNPLGIADEANVVRKKLLGE